jgi:hypothetical protein
MAGSICVRVGATLLMLVGAALRPSSVRSRHRWSVRPCDARRCDSASLVGATLLTIVGAISALLVGATQLTLVGAISASLVGATQLTRVGAISARLSVRRC